MRARTEAKRANQPALEEEAEMVGPVATLEAVVALVTAENRPRVAAATVAVLVRAAEPVVWVPVWAAELQQVRVRLGAVLLEAG
jgi:hypothetical protein